MGIENLIRRATPIVNYRGIDITESISPFFERAEITEVLEGELDSCTLRFNNKDGNFLKKNWALKKNELINFLIKTLNWENNFAGVKKSNIGNYYIDRRKFTKRKAIIKAISAPLEAKDTKNSKIWNKITLKNLGAEFATKYNLEYFYKTKKEITLTNIKQEEETDFSFLQTIATREGIKLKLTHSKVVLFEEELLLKKETKKSLSIDYFEDYEINDKSNEIYDAIELTYFDSKKNKKQKAVITKSELETGKKEENKKFQKLLKIKMRALTGDIDTLARNLLSRANRKEIEISFKMIGYTNLYTGDVIEILDAGEFSGRYLIFKLGHKLPKFETSVIAYKIKKEDKEQNDDK